MDTKISIRSLEIVNIEEVEEYLERMAEEGWLLSDIKGNSIFLFEKVSHMRLEFRISPFEIEDDYNIKTDEELKEFEDLCEYLGWNYLFKHNNLYIFYKKKDIETIEIHTDIEEENMIIKKLVKDRINSLLTLLVSYSLLALSYMKGLTIDVDVLQSGIRQLLIVTIPILVFSTLVELFIYGRFRLINRENIHRDNDIEYFNLNGFFLRSFNIFKLIILGAMMIYLVYIFLVYRDRTIIGVIFLLFLTLASVSIYRAFVKSRRISRPIKKLYRIGGSIMIILSLLLGTFYYILSKDVDMSLDDLDKGDYKLLLESDFDESLVDRLGHIYENHSLLVPRSYTYISDSSGQYDSRGLETEYSRASNEDIARNLFKRYIISRETNIRRYNKEDAENILELDAIGDGDLTRYNLTRDEFNKIRNMDKGKDLLLDRLVSEEIREGDKVLWSVDDIVYLTRDRDSLLLRKGLEVYRLEGVDFFKSENIIKTKEILGLNN